MQSKSATYNTIIAADNHSFEVKLNINGTDYGQDVIYGAKSDCKVFDTAPTIGGTYSGTLEFSLLGDGSAIPKMASVKPYFRAVLGATTSEWIQKGEFFIDTRSVSHNDNGLTVFSAHCFDAMLKANANYATSSLAWPATDTAVVAEIASKMGVSQDSRNSAILTGGYSIPLPTEYTMRDVLSFIAAMYAANWIITDEGKLRIVPIAGGADTLAVGKSCANLDISTSRSAYTKVIYEIDDETVVESGSTDTNVMEVYNPFGTQTEADAVYTILSAWSYKPFDASGVWSDPCVEVGDQITAVGESGTIYSRSITFGPGMVMELSAPNDNYVDHEYAYESPEERRYTRTVNGLSSSISLNASGVQIVSQKLDNFGGRNILLNSATLHWIALNGATVTHTTGQSVTEWLCNDAIRAVGNCGNVNGVCLQMYITSQTSDVYLADTHYIMSCYIKNNHATKSLWLAANNGTSEEIAPGEAKRAVAEVDGDGYMALRMRIYVAQTGDPFDFTYWHPQIECGEVLTAWNPAPEDKVGNNEIISKINVSPEGIVIQASKVDLAGYVTFTNLSTSGQTTVNGANITTGLIKDAANKNSWNLDTGALTITNGTINITTSSSTYDQIVLSYGNSKTTYSASAVSSILTNGGAQVARNWLGSQYFYMYDKNDDVIMSLYNGTSGGLAGTGYLRLYNGKAAQNYVPSISITNSLLANQSDIGVEDSTLSPKSLDFNEGAGNGTQIGLARYSNNGLSISKSQVVLLKQDKNGILFRNSSGTKTAEYPATGYNSQALESRNLCGRGAPLYNSGVTFTVNFDGSVTTSGVATNDIIYNFASFTSDGSEYKLSGCPAGGSATTFFMYYAGHSTDGWRDTGSGVIQTLSAGTWTPRIYVCSGANMNGKTFYPMVQRKNLEGNYSGTYVPWVSDLSTRECTYPTTRGNAMLANGLPVTLTFNGNTVAIISAIGYLGNAYAVFLYTGYALGSARQHITKLIGDNAVSLSISEAAQSVTLSYTGAAGMYVSVLPLFGPTPTFSY